METPQQQSNKHRSSPLSRTPTIFYTFCFILMLTARTARVASLSMSTMSSSSKNKLNFYWFRHQDLRLHDNAALQHCIDQSKKQPSATNGIVPIFCFDPRFISRTETPFGSPKCGVGRAKFILESVQNLRENLESNGSGLIVAHGKSEDVFEQLCQTLQNDDKTLQPNVFCQEEIASEELAVDKAMKRTLKKHQGSLESKWGSALYDIDDLPFADGVNGMPDTFTPFRNKMEKKCQIGTPLPKPSKSSLEMPTNQAILDIISGNSEHAITNCSLKYMPTLQDLGYTNDEIASVKNPDDRGVMPFMGGETAALARVQEYIFTNDRLKIYFDTRNGMLGADYSTKFSPWLAHGCLSPRLVAKECKRYEEETGIVNKSTYWYVYCTFCFTFFFVYIFLTISHPLGLCLNYYGETFSASLA